MIRIVAGCAVVCLGAIAAYAADAKVDTAVATFKATEADPAKVKTFCEMSKVMDAAGEKEDDATDAKIDGYMKALGADFETAWNAGEGVDENSADGKKLGAALDELETKCSS
jgi:hypothetical protein